MQWILWAGFGGVSLGVLLGFIGSAVLVWQRHRHEVTLRALEAAERRREERSERARVAIADMVEVYLTCLYAVTDRAVLARERDTAKQAEEKRQKFLVAADRMQALAPKLLGLVLDLDLPLGVFEQLAATINRVSDARYAALTSGATLDDAGTEELWQMGFQAVLRFQSSVRAHLTGAGRAGAGQRAGEDLLRSLSNRSSAAVATEPPQAAWQQPIVAPAAEQPSTSPVAGREQPAGKRRRSPRQPVAASELQPLPAEPQARGRSRPHQQVVLQPNGAHAEHLSTNGSRTAVAERQERPPAMRLGRSPDLLEDPRKHRFTRRPLPPCESCGDDRFIRTERPRVYRWLQRVGVEYRAYTCASCSTLQIARIRD